MSSVALLIDDAGPEAARIAMLIAKVAGVGVAAIRDSFGTGRPVFELEIFDRRNPGFPLQLLDLFERMDGLQCQWRAFEVLHDEHWSPYVNHFQLNAARMRNMIAEDERSLEEQRWLGERESGEI